MTDKSFVGVMLRGSPLDDYLLERARDYIITRAGMLTPADGRQLTKNELASALGIHRNRLYRLLTALEITGLFDTPRKKVNSYEKDAQC